MNRKFVTQFVKLSLIYVISGFVFSPLYGYAQQTNDPEELKDVQQIIVVVNDKPISLYDLKQRTRLFILSSGTKHLSEQERQYINQQALQNLINDKLRLQEAAKYKTTVDKSELKGAFASYAKRMGLSPEQFEQQLNQSGIRKESMLKQIEASLAWDKIVSGLLKPQVNIGDEEINTVLDRMKTNKGRFEYHPLEIFILVSNNDRRTESRDAAERIIKQLKNKASFQLMARQFSQSPTSAVGGDLGWLMKSQINPGLIGVIEKMKKGQISDPIETQDGFYIIQLVGKRQILTADKNDIRLDLQHLFFKYPDNIKDDERAALEKTLTKAAEKIETCDNIKGQADKLGATETGNLGTLSLSEIPENLQKVLTNVAVGHASAPIKEKKGFRILLVCGKNAPVVHEPDYKSVQANLSQQRIDLIARRHLRDLRRDAIIDYK